MQFVIRETLEKVVEADSIEDVITRYKDEKIVLSADDFVEVEFTKAE